MRYALFLAFLTILPYFCGMSVLRGERRNPLAAWCTGWLVMYALLYFPAVLGIEAGWTLDFTVRLWLLLMAAAAVPGFWQAAGLLREKRESAGGFLRRISVFEWAALILVLLHAFMTFRGMYVDDDDIYYVGAAATSSYTNTVLKYDPAVGNLLTGFHYQEVRKLVTAPLFVFYAAFSRMFGIQTAALCHTYLPPVFTCLFYGIFYMLGESLFPESRERRAIFVILVFLIHMFSWYSVYTAGTFLMIRSWQGKAQIVGAVLPMILTIFLYHSDEAAFSAKETGMLMITMAAACLMSSMGAVLASGLVVLSALIRSVMARSPRILYKSLPALVLPALSAFMYLRL